MCKYFIVFLKYDASINVRKVAVVASRKIGKAVLRNKAKRRMREVVRLSKEIIKPGTSIVMVARKPILTAKFSILIECFQKLLSKYHENENKQIT